MEEEDGIEIGEAQKWSGVQEAVRNFIDENGNNMDAALHYVKSITIGAGWQIQLLKEKLIRLRGGKDKRAETLLQIIEEVEDCAGNRRSETGESIREILHEETFSYEEKIRTELLPDKLFKALYVLNKELPSGNQQNTLLVEGFLQAAAHAVHIPAGATETPEKVPVFPAFRAYYIHHPRQEAPAKQAP